MKASNALALLLRRNIELSIGLATFTAVLMILVGCFGLQWQARQKTLKTAYQTAHAVAIALEVQTDAIINATDKTLRILAKEARLQPGSYAQHDAAAVGILKEWQRQTAFIGRLWVTDALGNIVHDSDDWPGSLNITKRSYFSELRDNPDLGLYVGPMIASAQEGWFIPISRRINHADGTFAGVVAAALEPKAFEAMYARLSLGTDSAVSLISPDATLIARVPVFDELRGKPMPDLANILNPLQTQAQGQFRLGSAVDGVSRLFAFRKIENRQLIVLVGFGEGAALHNWQRTNFALGLSAVGLSCLLAMMGWLAISEFRRSRMLHLKLQQSENLLGRLLEFLPVPVFAKNVQDEFRWTVWNKAAEELFGIRRQDCLGKPDADFFPKEQTDMFRRSDRQAIESGEVIENTEESVPLATGPGVLRVRKLSLRDPKGNPSFVLGVCLDITEQIHLESERNTAIEALTASEAFARSTLDAVTQQLCVLDKHGTILVVNQAWRDFGAANGAGGDGVGANYLGVCDSSRDAGSAEAGPMALGLLSVMRGEQDSFALEYPCDSLTEKRWFYCRVLRFHGDSGNLVVVHENVTLYKQAQAQLKSANLALARTQLFLRSVTDQVPSMIGYWDSDLRNRFANAAYQEWFGRANDTLDGAYIKDLLGSELFALNEPYIRLALQGQSQRFDCVLTMSDGQPRQVITDFIPDINQNGSVAGFIVLITDVTHLKRTQDALSASNLELQRSNADLERFACAVSHDLIEPLRSVTSSVQLLQVRYAGQLDARADEFIAHAVGGATRMQTLIGDLLAFSKVASQRQLTEDAAMDDALGEAVKNLRTAILESNAKITYDPLPHVVGHSKQITQLLQNLLANAIKFRGNKAAVVHVGARREGSEWVFSVADEGIGIESQYFARVFELFKRLHTREEYAGTGIGLTLCKRIVERHGGRIWVESVPGQGTTFRFTLPVAG